MKEDVYSKASENGFDSNDQYQDIPVSRVLLACSLTAGSIVIIQNFDREWNGDLKKSFPVRELIFGLAAAANYRVSRRAIHQKHLGRLNFLRQFYNPLFLATASFSNSRYSYPFIGSIYLLYFVEVVGGVNIFLG
jgi:hypothetical protein